LTPQKTAELLAKLQAIAFQGDILARAAAQIEQGKSAGPFAEALDAQDQLPARLVFDAGNPAHQIAAMVPSLQAQPAVARFEQKIIGGNRKRLFAGLAQDWLGTGLKEAFDSLADVGQLVRLRDAVPALTLGATFRSPRCVVALNVSEGTVKP
jgi:hypothetical protein